MKIKAFFTTSLLLVSISQVFALNAQAKKSKVVENYADIVLSSYEDSLSEAKNLQKSIDKFLNDPSKSNLEDARKAWLTARIPYLQTEAYRFYQGPIDFENSKNNESGPEVRINSWPVNEAYIDYVKGNKKSGIINDLSTTISIDTLKERNQQKDEADVATGYHAIEFLLWGQDFNINGPGNRPYTDYLAGNKINERRRIYLKTSAQLLVEDLQYLVNSWQKNQNNYRKKFISMSEKEALGKILTGIASMSANEFANERINNALISGDQEDEQSCFSDNTKNDYIYNFRGIKNVYFGNYEKVSGLSISNLLEKSNAELNSKIIQEINEIEFLISNIDEPFDTKVLGVADNKPARQKMHEIVKKLRNLGSLFVQAGNNLGANAIIVSE